MLTNQAITIVNHGIIRCSRLFGCFLRIKFIRIKTYSTGAHSLWKGHHQWLWLLNCHLNHLFIQSHVFFLLTSRCIFITSDRIYLLCTFKATAAVVRDYWLTYSAIDWSTDITRDVVVSLIELSRQGMGITMWLMCEKVASLKKYQSSRSCQLITYTHLRRYILVRIIYKAVRSRLSRQARLKSKQGKPVWSLFVNRFEWLANTQ